MCKAAICAQSKSGLATFTMPKKNERLKIWPGVTSSHLVEILRRWLQNNKSRDMINAFKDLLNSYFKLSPRLALMVRFADLARALVGHAKNAMLSHVTLVAAFHNLMVLEPSLAPAKQPRAVLLELSRGLRTLLTWYRKLAKGGKAKATLLASASPAQTRIITEVAEEIFLMNHDEYMKMLEKRKDPAESASVEIENKFEPAESALVEIENKFEPAESALVEIENKFEPAESALVEIENKFAPVEIENKFAPVEIENKFAPVEIENKSALVEIENKFEPANMVEPFMPSWWTSFASGSSASTSSSSSPPWPWLFGSMEWRSSSRSYKRQHSGLS